MKLELLLILRFLDTFLVSQTYAIIVLPNGGPDLETYQFSNAKKTGWQQACSVFWQVAKALARAEQLVSFEVCVFVNMTEIFD
jgi:serine/threonine-protein kinase haspin